MDKILLLMAGSVAGGLARYYLSTWIYRYTGSLFPYGTIFVNALGCFLIGFFVTFAGEKLFLNPNSRLLAMTGFCGAFTTFSTFIFETTQLVERGNWGSASLNVVVSLVLGLLFFYGGFIFGKLF